MQPVNPSPAKTPERITLPGRYVTLAPFKAAEHEEALWNATKGKENDDLWRYLFEGPFDNRADHQEKARQMEASADPLYYAILDNITRKAVGRASFLRIEPKHRCIEVGAILFSPLLQKTRGATEAMYLMMRYAFEDLGNRRYEWKCNAQNEPSRSAARRLGFTFEGTFRQHMIVKDCNRDTAWFSVLDSEWPTRKAAFESWLGTENFDQNGQQKKRLEDFR